MPLYNEKEAQIIERIKKGELRLDSDLLWLIVHFVNNRIQMITLPIQWLELKAKGLNEQERSKLETVKKQAAEIQSFLNELAPFSRQS